MADWTNELDSFLQKTDEYQVAETNKLKDTKDLVEDYFSSTVTQAFNEFKSALEARDRQVKVVVGKGSASVQVHFHGQVELDYYLNTRISSGGASIYPETHNIDSQNGRPFVAEGVLRSGAQDYSFADISKDELIRHMLSEFKKSVESRLRK